MNSIGLSTHVIGRALLSKEVLSERQLDDVSKELHESDKDLEHCCPMDAVRLRSMDAMMAYGVWLYVLVRHFRPTIVVETGVQNGCSTEMILWAIHRNQAGRLYSIDSGGTSSDGSHKTSWNETRDGIPGKDIHDGLKRNWDLTIGLSSSCLNDLCQRLERVDLFWHDSDHSAENVQFEFLTIKPYVSCGGILCLHDFNGQPIDLGPPAFDVILPHEAPLLRGWRRIV